VPRSSDTQSEKIRLLNRRLERSGARWRAKDSAVSRLSSDEFKRMLGWAPAARALSMDMRTFAPHLLSWSPGDPFDQEVDWRNRNGKNYVTPVKNQGGCGTCVAFAVNAQVEAMALIEMGVLLDLSEADLAFNGSHVADCSGWEQGQALSDVKKDGVVSEKRLSYNSVFVPTDSSWLSPPSKMPIADKEDFAVKVDTFSNISSIAERKSYLTHVGPLSAGITAYDDFAAFGSGVYHETAASKGIGGHCVLVIGYSEARQSWIIKNSWDITWGQEGFGEIGYGACAIDIQGTYFTSCGGLKIPQAYLDETIVGIGNATLTGTEQPICCDGFYSNDDAQRHVITGTVSGDVVETFFHPKVGSGQTKLFNVAGLRDVGSFYTSDDDVRHAIALDQHGVISEIYYSPKYGVSVTQLTTIDGANKVCGFYTSDDDFRHAIVGTSLGDIFEIFYGKGKGQAKIATVKDLTDIGGFYSPDDDLRHAITASLDGTITEIFYSPTKGIHTAVLATIPGVRRISAFYAPKSQLYSRRVLVMYEDGGTRNICELRYSSASRVLRNELGAAPGAADLGGFFSGDDQMSHCVIGFTSGESREFFY
jgi:hypothetical protein